MDNAELFVHIDRLKKVVLAAGQNYSGVLGAKAQVTEFLRNFAGPKSSFLSMAEESSGSIEIFQARLMSVLDNFRSYVEADLSGGVSPTRRAQLDVVSDFLEQAQLLLDSRGVHPAAPIVLIGATLEEFLRTWVESEGFSLGNRKPSLDAYAQVLANEGKLTKQDVKDLTAWGGLRNHAAHGEWSEVSDKLRASLMLEGVNLFMRKYAA